MDFIGNGDQVLADRDFAIASWGFCCILGILIIPFDDSIWMVKQLSASNEDKSLHIEHI